MRQYILRRILYSFLILFFISIFIFTLGRVLPGDPVQAVLMTSRMGPVDAEVMEDLKAQFGLDKPLPVQYLVWAANFIRGDWGISIASGEEVLRHVHAPAAHHPGAFLGSVLLGRASSGSRSASSLRSGAIHGSTSR